jgi:hypothetical protein
MWKQLLARSSALAFVLVGSSFAPSIAQTPSQPSQTAPNQTQPQQGAPQTQVNQADLQKFAQALQQIHSIREEGRSQALRVLQQVGLTQERFIQIAQAQETSPQQNNATPPNSSGSSARPGAPANGGSQASQLQLNATPEELQHFQQASTQIEQIQRDSQGRMRQAIEGQGLNIQQFNQILATVRQSPQLQQQVINLLNSRS